MLSTEPRGGLVKNTELVGASPSFRYPMYYYKEGQQDSATGDAGTGRVSQSLDNKHPVNRKGQIGAKQQVIISVTN